MKKYIYINYFRDSNPERQKEYLHCINHNLGLDFVDAMIVFLEKEEHKSDLPESSKIQYVYHPQRMEFKDVFDHANKNIEPDSVIVILNLDIFLENSEEWKSIDHNFFEAGYADKALVLTRHNIVEYGSNFVDIESDYWLHGNFCDAWVLKTPLKEDFLEEDFEFCVGNAPQCDNLMMGLMSKYYHTFSWGSKYRIYHYDVCRGAKSMQDKLDNFPKAVDYRARDRRSQHMSIPTMQPWEYMLENKIRPYSCFSWFDMSLTYPASHRPNAFN